MKEKKFLKEVKKAFQFDSNEKWLSHKSNKKVRNRQTAEQGCERRAKSPSPQNGSNHSRVGGNGYEHQNGVNNTIYDDTDVGRS